MRTLRLRLPATSANLGPGFDTLALALSFFLEIEATAASKFSIEATGLNADVCSHLPRNLLIGTYEGVLIAHEKPVLPLAIRMHNGIPIGKGCGSSAAVRLAGVALASFFGGLEWDRARILDHAVQLEGHPDNVAACWQGGLSIVGSVNPLAAISIPAPSGWYALVVIPNASLATSKARLALPAAYSREDVVRNLQSVALLTAAFTLSRADLMPIATRDVLHQPYRSDLCPLLPALLPLVGLRDVLSVTLSGAGPSVLLITSSPPSEPLAHAVREATQTIGPVELLTTTLCPEGASMVAIDR
jgi:homoserine kinase